MYFFINQNSELPILEMELITNGIVDYEKFAECIQNADITFTMYNKDTSVIKISNAKAYVRLESDDSCYENYIICYDWKKRDTKDKGTYIGQFTITFNDNIVSEITTYPSGKLIMPIRDELNIIIK